jgi:hypothetical protein
MTGWKDILMNRKLSEEFMAKYENIIDWEYISKYQKLSEEFMEKHINKIGQWLISRYQILSEKIMEKYFDKIDWYNVSYFQKLSEKFIEKYKNKINANGIIKNKKIMKNYELSKILHTPIIMNDELIDIKKFKDGKNIFFVTNDYYMERFKKYINVSSNFLR